MENGKIKLMFNQRRLVLLLDETLDKMFKEHSVALEKKLYYDVFRDIVLQKKVYWADTPKKVTDLLNNCIEDGYIQYASLGSTDIVIGRKGRFLKSIPGFMEEFLGRFSKITTVLFALGIGAVFGPIIRGFVAWLGSIIN